VSPLERVMVDTSAWIEGFRGRSETVLDVLRTLLAEDRVLTCGPVCCEIRRGLRPHERTRVLPLLAAVPRLAFEDVDWDEAGILDADLRSQGVTIPPFDLLIARVCLRENVPLYTFDDHFDGIPGLRRYPTAPPPAPPSPSPRRT
jgi:predicted nucleic acid-binding protein